jgi:serine/threonine protein kinase
VTTPTHVEPVVGATPMTPDRWRAVDTIVQIALACAPGDRDSIVADACEGDEALHAEVASLLAAHRDTEEFLERPAAPAFMPPDSAALADRLAKALAGRYSIEREVARGGMATVYLARDLRHGRPVAIKVLRDELVAAVGDTRFLAEIRVTASLQHPHILPLFDSGATDGMLWYAMPYVEGETLRSHLDRTGRLPVAEAVRIAREIAGALDHAHAHGIVHRDIKPENVLLQDGHALIADFGIALALEQAGGERITRTGLALGTPQYMAPEQASGERALDARVDVYALGAVLHEMLAGEPPFAAPTRQAVVRRMMHELPPVLASHRPDVPPFLDAAVRRALAKRPSDRFPSASAFDRAIATSLIVPLYDADPEPTPAAGVKPAKSGRSVSARASMYAAAAMLVIGLVGGLLVDRSLVSRQGQPVSVPPRMEAQSAPVTKVSLSVVDRTGRMVRDIPAERPWTPRFSPDGRSVAYGAFGAGRTTSDLWITDLSAGTTRRITDDDADANDPQWSPDAASIAYSAGQPGGKALVMRTLGSGALRTIQRERSQFPNDWLRDGSALLITEERGDHHDIIVQPSDGSASHPFVATDADETAPRISPDGRWVAYTSDASGRPEVYLDSYAHPGRGRLTISLGGGMQPVWRGDGRELYYWRNGELVAVRMAASVDGAAPVPGAQTVLFRAAYQGGINTMYDVSPDGQRFVIVQQP